MTKPPNRPALSLVLSLLPIVGFAQDAPDWQETQVPPPAFQTERLQRFDVTVDSSLTYGLDPATVSVGPDYVVRYVVVALSRSGALNAMYEGVRCKTAEVRRYARWDNNRLAWTLSGSGWEDLSRVRHAARLANAAFCQGNAVSGSPAQILQILQKGRDPER